MSPKALAPSPFGSDVNPPATLAEDLALYNSIEENGIQVPLTVGRVKGEGKGKPKTVNGNRRLKIAMELGLADVPVIVKDYESIEEMRQDALRDNLERRQLSIAARADLANALWRSFDRARDKKEMAAQGIGPRKRAAIAGGLSEGSLAKFRYVLDSGIDRIIADMRSGKLSIDKAHGLARKEVEGGKGDAGEQDIPARMKRLLSDLDDLVHVLKAIPETARRARAVRESLAKGTKGDYSRIEKKMQAAAKIIMEAQSHDGLSALCLALNAPILDSAPDVGSAAAPPNLAS
ncbi:MAG: ParB N-terminal domain-containing protein [Planctomycetota bacterium]|jgi:hypothetical protein|nr:ParB N-terminal domain-containing protein [Planctomycetota bacterium]